MSGLVIKKKKRIILRKTIIERMIKVLDTLVNDHNINFLPMPYGDLFDKYSGPGHEKYDKKKRRLWVEEFLKFSNLSSEIFQKNHSSKRLSIEEYRNEYGYALKDIKEAKQKEIKETDVPTLKAISLYVLVNVIRSNGELREKYPLELNGYSNSYINKICSEINSLQTKLLNGDQLKSLASISGLEWKSFEDEYLEEVDDVKSYLQANRIELEESKNQDRAVITQEFESPPHPLIGIWRIYRFSSDGKSISRKWMEIKATSDKELVGDFFYWKETKNEQGTANEGISASTSVKIHCSPISEVSDAQVWINSIEEEEENKFYFSGILSIVDYEGQNPAGTTDSIIRGFGTRSARIEEQNAILNSPFSMVKYADADEQSRDLKELVKGDFETDNDFHNREKDKTLDSREATVLEHLSIQPSRPSLRYANNQSLYYLPYPDGFEITTFKNGWTKLLGREKFTKLKEVFLNNSTSPSYHEIKEQLDKVDSNWIDKKDTKEIKEKKENSLGAAISALIGMSQWVSITSNYDLRIASENSIPLTELYKEYKQKGNENEVRNETRFNRHYFIFYAEEREQALFVFRLKIDGENNRAITKYHGEVKYARDHIYFSLQHFRYDPKNLKENLGKRKTPYPDFDQTYYKYSWSDFSDETRDRLKKSQEPHLELLSSSIITVEKGSKKHRQSYALRELLIKKEGIAGKLPEKASPFLSTNEFERLGDIQHLQDSKLDNRLRLAYSGHSGLSFNTNDSSHFVKENRSRDLLFERDQTEPQEYIILLLRKTNEGAPDIMLFSLKIRAFGLVEYSKVEVFNNETYISEFEGWSEINTFHLSPRDQSTKEKILSIQLRKIRSRETSIKQGETVHVKHWSDGLRIRFHLKIFSDQPKDSLSHKTPILVGTCLDFSRNGMPCATTCLAIDKKKFIENFEIEEDSELDITRKVENKELIGKLDTYAHEWLQFHLGYLFNGTPRSEGFLSLLFEKSGDILFEPEGR